jgi:acetate---CoA ligase (ADP-forming)
MVDAMASGAGASAHENAQEDLRIDIVLRDGSTAHVRAVRADDAPRLYVFLRELSPESAAFRFFGRQTDAALEREAARQAAADGDRVVGLVATTGRDEHIIAHAEFSAVGDRRSDRAEVGFAVADAHQGQGIGTILLGHLAQIASAKGIHLFGALVRPENGRMLAVFRESGFPVTTHVEPGEIHVEFPTELTAEALEHFDHRDWTAAVNAVRPFFHARSVAVIGASRRRGTIAGEVLHNLLSYEFNGPVFPVNPSAPVVQSIVAYATVEEVPALVDLAVIVVPADRVLDVAEACGRKRVRALVVISAGFAEAGEAGRERQAALMRICRAAGMRLIGPNCMGIITTDPDVRLNATFVPSPPLQGRIAFMSQSGGLGLAIMDYASELGLGLSSFVSVGNKADISGNDLVRYWEQDDKTDLILLYLESFGNPRKFSRIARAVARRKPIIAVKSGRSPAGTRATSSHTGALIAASDVTVDALFRQSGVIRTDTLEEMFDIASLLGSQPAPKGRRVAILTNAGGPGILCADACAAEGLEVPTFDHATEAQLRALLPAEASVANPVDMIASASGEQYRAALEILGRDPNVDAVIVIFIPPLVTKPEDAARAIVEGTRALQRAKPVLTVFMQSRGVPDELRAADVRVPSYSFPENAARALAGVVRYGEWLARPEPVPPALTGIRRDEAASIVATALGRDAQWLGPDEVWSLLSCYGLPLLEQRVVKTADDAAAVAAELGGEVAIKAIAPGLVHKTEAGAVQLRLAPDAVLWAAREMAARIAATGSEVTGFVVQRMAAPGVEMIIGVVHDRQFGPVVACGAGGVLVELVKDVSVRLTPLAEQDAAEMVRELKTYPLLTGYRGSPPRDVRALEDAVVRIGALVEDLPQIAELDLNPILVHEHGATIVDARVRVAAAAPAPPIGAVRG